MGSSCEANGESVDATVGGLVWVRRRNGCWWPARILGVEELPDGCAVGVPRVGTPVKLLGREDANVDWYNFERSKRVKPFRCGEYDDWIEKAKNTASLSNKITKKYIRREHAILHALEIERSQLSENNHEHSSQIDRSDNEQPDEETENMSDKLSGLESLSVSPPEHRPDVLVNDSEDDRSKKRMRGLKDIGIVGKLKPSVKRRRSQVAYGHDCVKRKNRSRQLTKVLKTTEAVMVPDTCEKYRNLNGLSGVEYNDVKQSLSNSSGESSGRLFDVPYIGCEAKQTAGLVTENENAQAVGGPQSGQSSLVETVSAGPDEIQESGSISSGAAGANDLNNMIIGNGTSEWQHKGKRNSRVKTKNVQKILYPEVKIEPDLISDTVTAPQRSMPYRHSRFTVNPKYQSCVSYNDNDTISLYDVDIEVQAGQIPQDIPYISLMSKSTRQRITGHSLLVEVMNDSVSDLPLIGSECISSSYELDPVDVAMVSEDSKKSKIRKLSSLTCLKKPSETSKVIKCGRGKYIRDKTRKALSETGQVKKLGRGKYIRDKTRKFKTLDMVRSCEMGELKGGETGKLRDETGMLKSDETGKPKRPDEVPACVPLKVVFSRIHAALGIR